MIVICNNSITLPFGRTPKCRDWILSTPLLLVGVHATFGEEGSGKRSYSLSNPTPDSFLREMTTDRPDITEVPFTVDAGRVQIETTGVGFSRSRPAANGAVTQGYEFIGSNIRIGLTKDLEATIMVLPYARQRTRSSESETTESGTGAVVLRAKYNLWGNDTFGKSDSTALAVLPYISLPTDRQNGISPQFVDGGLQTFFAADLGHQFSLGINVGLHAVKNADPNARHIEATGSMTLGYQWSEKFTTYVEAAVRGGTQDPLGDIVLFGGGLAYKVNSNLQLDAGVNFGATPASPSINPFVGLSARF